MVPLHSGDQEGCGVDPETFDQHARRLGNAVSRRIGLARLGAGLLALLGGGLTGDADARPGAGKRCLRLGKRCKRGRRRAARCCGAARCLRGRCRCHRTHKTCHGQCILKTACCRDRECGAGAICLKGRCRCRPGQRVCQGTCLPPGACCGNAECGSCESCVDGRCVSGCQAGQECQSGQCRCTGESCPGCCDGEVCRDGDRDGACGSGGEQCVRCGVHADCEAGICRCDEGFQDCDGTCQECCGTRDCGSGEVCDDGTCVIGVCGNGGPCTVFVRAAGVQGNEIGGLDGADALCQATADAAWPWVPTGTYRAWLSDSTGSPDSRFMKSPGPYVLVDGTQIASNWADLTDGELAAPINRTETGGESDTAVWTNTTTLGLAEFADDSRSCRRWDGSIVEFGAFGRSTSTDGVWTDASASESCIEENALYCFQQA